MKWPLLIAAIGACGGDADHPVDASCPDSGPACGSACDATFTGNFDASSASIANCAQVSAGSGSAAADSVLAFNLGTASLAAPLAVSIDVGPSPAAGSYSSETSPAWSALGLRMAAAGACVYSGGTDGVPAGSFTLTLAAIDPAAAHGELLIVDYVQAQEGVDCGSGDIETVDVQF